ncbi:hypothetical protein D9611_011740 [Ephemerocybe angulata]|uniref:HRDC domain-containing protein n=1 Tax=Ephemerocybe angulata TaxID=980116 RepID=A0A8H5C793_9AGAR|nr:hypothetical protein D9611_011740 [Tulosesus angulatus]
MPRTNAARSVGPLTLGIDELVKGKLLYVDPATEVAYYGNVDDPNRVLLNEKKKRSAVGRVKKRLVVDRDPLASRLVQWRRKACKRRGPAHHHDFILSNKSLTLITNAHPPSISTATKLASFLSETPAWSSEFAQEIIDVIVKYDAELKELRKNEGGKKKKATTEPPSKRQKRSTVPEEVEMGENNEDVMEIDEDDDRAMEVDNEATAFTHDSTQKHSNIVNMTT